MKRHARCSRCCRTASQRAGSGTAAAGGRGAGPADEKKAEPRYFPHPRQQAGPRGQEGRERQHPRADDCRSRRAAARRVVPRDAGKKKIQLDNGTELDLSKIHYTDLEAMIKDIGELTVDVDGDAQVRIRCE